MLYSNEIDDGAKIQLIILFTLKNAARTVRYDDLINIIFENCNVNYAEFQIALSHLEEIKYIGKSTDETGCDVFYLLPEGDASSEYLEDSIPVYIKNPIKKYIKPYFKEEDAKQKIKAEAVAVRGDEYSAHLTIFDDDEISLLDLDFYTGSRDEALEIVRRFKENPEKLYRKVLSCLISDENDSPDEC